MTHAGRLLGRCVPNMACSLAIYRLIKLERGWYQMLAVDIYIYIYIIIQGKSRRPPPDNSKCNMSSAHHSVAVLVQVHSAEKTERES